MATIPKTRRPQRTRPTAPARDQLIRFSFIDWPTYVAYSDGLGPRHVRVTYADGEMELMTLGRKHERAKKRLATLAEAWADEMGIDMEPGGSMTFRREDLLRGMEPDECNWIKHEPLMRDRDDYDPHVDPPPDLAMEVEISRSTMDRLEIYAKLKVPEVWRWDDVTLTCLGLVRRRYEALSHSRAFPQLRAADLQPFLVPAPGVSQASAVRQFRHWIRERIAADWR